MMMYSSSDPKGGQE